MSRIKPLSEFALYRELKALFPPAQFAVLPQVGNSTGFDTTRHADAIALGLWPSRGIHLHGFEIKSYRHDWVRELSKPEKAEEIAARCNYWWVVAGQENIVQDGELPEPWGLLAWSEKASALAKIKAAKFSDAQPLDTGFLAAILRKAQSVSTPESAILEAENRGYERGKKEAESNAKHDMEDFAKLKRSVLDFEQASGVIISHVWEPTKKIGHAVKTVMNGDIEQGREDLLRTARRIIAELDGAA